MATCGVCGKDNPDGFRFCGFCGAGLSADQSASSTRERKVISVLFCDLVGFTAASESADPEEVQARIAPYHARTRDRIEAFGGTMEKFIGDAVMAVFGAPVAFEDDAERAVRAGLAILEGIEELNAADGALELSVRIGVNTGEAVVSLDSRPEQGEGMVTGDVVNTAARIQAAAPVDGIAVGAGTYAATDRVFEYEPLEPIAAKGKSEPVQVWRAIAPVARFGSDVIRSLTTPLVGRETDLTLLRSLFDKTASDREMQLVTVVGEPGVGKSRLVAELFAYIDELPELITWRQGRCLPYGDGITFWALGEIVKAHAGIYESDSAEEAAAKLDGLLLASDDHAWLLARLLPLIGVEAGPPPSREESFTAWRRFLEGIAEEGPLVLVVEDIHWADEAMLTFLEHLADWARGVPMLVICTARPELYERHPAWSSGLANQAAITLSPLSDTETARLVAELLQQAVLPAETQQLLLERAGGNPLYAEEFVRMLRDREILDERGGIRLDSDVPFPDSIQALIAARLDTLPAERKHLLQDAAVIGKVFWAGALVSIGSRTASDVDAALHELGRKEIVRPSRQSSMEGEAEYVFWHALVRDVAYQQIPRRERAEKHVAASAWIESKAGDRLEDLADVVAHHAGEALDIAQAIGDAQLRDEVAPKARRFALLAGERASGLDPARALTLLDRALELTAADDAERAVVLLQWGRVARETGRIAEGAAALTEAIDLCRLRGDVEMMASALGSLTQLSRELGTSGWHRHAEEALAVLEPRPPSASRVEALANLAHARMLQGSYEDAIGYSERALRLASELETSPPPRAFAARGGARCSLGERSGLEDDREALRLYVTSGDSANATRAYNNHAIDTLLFDGPVAAIDVITEGETFAAQRGLTHAASSTGETKVGFLFMAGRLDEALEITGRSLVLSEASGDLVSHCDALAFRTIALAERGDARPDDAERAIAEARQLADPDALILGLATQAHALACADDGVGARERLSDLAAADGVAASTNFGQVVGLAVRSALAVGSLDHAEKLVGRIEPLLPICAHGLLSGRALITEAYGNAREAADLFDQAAERWKAFGASFEHAYALLGHGRCLVAAGDSTADVRLRAARSMFDDMGIRLRVDECDALIARAMKLSS